MNQFFNDNLKKAKEKEGRVSKRDSNASFFKLDQTKKTQIGGFIMDEYSGCIIGHILEDKVEELMMNMQTMILDDDGRMILSSGTSKWLVTDFVINVPARELKDYIDVDDDTIKVIRQLGNKIVKLCEPFALIMVVDFVEDEKFVDKESNIVEVWNDKEYKKKKAEYDRAHGNVHEVSNKDVQTFKQEVAEIGAETQVYHQTH